MRRLRYALLALVIFQLPVFAQQHGTRTTVTKIADLLAQQPAETSERFDEAMSQLDGFTAADIAALLQQLTPPGKGNNSGIEYATNSYSFHVMQAGRESHRAKFVQGAITALGNLADKDNKGYVIKLLQQAGKDDAVEILKTYLTDEYLSGKAARALASIDTESAGEALLQAVPSSTGTARIHLINALGFMGFEPAEQAILEIAATADGDEKKVALSALSTIGSQAAVPVLEKAAQDAGWVYDRSNATAAYINHTAHLIDKGELGSVKKSATMLLNSAKLDNQTHTRIAALSLLTDLNKTKQTKALVKASKTSNPVYRNAALGFLKPYLDSKVTRQLLSRLSRQEEQVQVDIIQLLADNNQVAALPEIRKSLDSDSPIVRVAAVGALHQLAGEAAMPELLGILPQGDEQTRNAIKQVFLTSKSEQLVPSLVSALSTTQDPGLQVLFLDVLANRGAEGSVPTVFGLLASDAPQGVKSAAAKALPQIVNPEDLEQLLAVFPAEQGDHTALVRQAIISSVNRSADKNAQTKKVIARMQSADVAKQADFMALLAGIGGSEALEAVSGYNNNDNQTLRNAAILSVSGWTDTNALPILVSLSKTTKDAAQLDAVLKGLVRLVGVSDSPADQKVLQLRDAFEVAQTAEQKRLVIRALEANKTYNALLFAGKYLDDDELKSVAANTVMNIALEDKRFYGSDVTILLKKVIHILSGSESGYLREAILKHLAESPKGAGYVSLFNGTDLSGWKGLVADPIKRAKMDAETLAAEQAKADEEMRAGWYAEAGVLHFNGHGNNIVTTRQYGDFELLVDWKLAKEGKDGDAGIYLRGTPQVQIWDTSRVKVGAQVGSGGLYNNKKHESKPLKVADNALGEWNTFRVKMVGDRVTVYLNGELVTDSVVLENFWDRELPIFPVEQLELQAHGTLVSYRDIYIRELPRKEIFTLSDEEKEAGFEVLFDGTNLDSWTGNTTSYVINEEGALAIYPTEGSGGNLYTKEEFGDFSYRFEFRLTPGANNGVGIRTPLDGNPAYEGMEIQVLDNGADMYKDLAEYQYHGSVYGIIPAKRGYLKPLGEWNEQEIYVKGNKIKVTLNGAVIVDGDLAEATKGGALDKKDHPGLKRTSGHIAFLGHGSEVYFRNIRVKRL